MPVLASFTTRSARLTRADLIRAGDQLLLERSNSTAAEPAMCGVAIDVPVKKAQASSPVHSFAPTQLIELRTFTATDVRSGLTAKSTLVGPWPLRLYEMSLFA